MLLLLLVSARLSSFRLSPAVVFCEPFIFSVKSVATKQGQARQTQPNAHIGARTCKYTTLTIGKSKRTPLPLPLSGRTVLLLQFFALFTRFYFLFRFLL